MALDIHADQTLSRHARAAELLDAETEADLARAWRDDRDEAALHRLITAYMRLAISVAWRPPTGSIPIAACGFPPMPCGGFARACRIS